MTTQEHETFVYIGMGGEGDNIGQGGLYRRGDANQEWKSITSGLPDEPQVRALLIHPDNPSIILRALSQDPTEATIEVNTGRLLMPQQEMCGH